MIVIACVLSGCAGNDNAEIVKKSSKLQEINLTLYNGKSVNVTESEKIEDIVKVINGAASTKEESVQDVPDAEQYVGIYQCNQDLNLYFKSIADL